MTDARELPVRLDRDASEPLARQLGDALRDAVRCGKLSLGSRLPATRTFAADLSVSRGVVVEAYEQLIAEGYLVGRAGGGTWVNPAAARSPDVASSQQSRWQQEEDIGRAVVDLRPGAPDLRTFPRSRWEAAVRQVLRDASDAELGYSAPWGVPRLREQLASYLGRVRGAVAAPDSVVVTSGATQALTIFTRTLVRRGHRLLAVEDPSNAVQRGVLASHGVRVLDVPVDADGIDVDALARTDARAVLVTPAHQFPTGGSLSPQRRAALLRWARAVDGFVIEDDYDAEFRYDGQSSACVQGDDPMRVALVGSVSKTLAPALRLGWIVPPVDLVTAVAETKRDDDFGTDVITQLAFAHLLHSGRYDRHLRTVRKLYAQRRADLVREMVQHLPDWKITGLAAGQHLSIELPGTLDEAAVAEQARRRGLLVLEMASMRGRPGPPALVLSFARVAGSIPRHVVEVLTAAAGDVRPVHRSPDSRRAQAWAPRGPAATVNAEDFYGPRP